jgi:DNA-binding NtrC family response regulator
MMPRLGGLDTLKRIRKYDPNLTVIVVTGSQDPDLERQALSLGAAAFFAKPISPADLLPALVRSQAGPQQFAGRRKPTPDHLPAPGAEVLQGGRILIVDDEAEIRMVLEEFLAHKGYQVGSAEDGAAAVRAVMDKAPDVVLLDLNMPRLGGIEALAAIRAIHPNVKVIIISAQADLGLAKRSLACGAYDYIAKPFDMTYLANCVETALLTKGLDAGVPHCPGEDR